MNALTTGIAFGAALTAAGVYQPSVIIGQLRLENWHMIQSFLTATAVSGAVLEAARRLGRADFAPRGFSSLGLFRRRNSKNSSEDDDDDGDGADDSSLSVPYDGNIVGGLLLGTGMALSGACPGTVLAQVGLGIPSGIHTLGGAVFGGAVWSAVLRPNLARRADSLRTSPPAPRAPPAVTGQHKNDGERQGQQNTVTVTMHGVLGLSRMAGLIGMEALFGAIIAATVLLTSPGPEAKIHPVAGGLAIGSAQLLSMLLRQMLLGVSASYEEMGDWFRGWLLFAGKAERAASSSSPSPPRRFSNVLFALGIITGAWLLAAAAPRLAQTTAVAVSPLMGGLGGFLMVIGARIAGGCTSGHGISGISLLSVSSVITIGVAFSWGSVFVRLLDLF